MPKERMIKNISKILINKRWIALGITLEKDKELIYGPDTNTINIQIHLLIIHIKLGILYKASRRKY